VKDAAGGRMIGSVAVVSSTIGEVAFNGLNGSDVRNYTNPAASTAVTGTTETLAIFDNASRTIGANVLKVGTTFRIRAHGIFTATTGAETLVIGFAFGGSSVMVSGDLDPADNGIWSAEAEFCVRAVGATGTMVGSGLVRHGLRAAAATATHVLATGTTTTTTVTIDTTGANVAAVYVDRQAAATDTDSCRCDRFVFEIVG
jgi:hypothetical protein